MRCIVPSQPALRPKFFHRCSDSQQHEPSLCVFHHHHRRFGHQACLVQLSMNVTRLFKKKKKEEKKAIFCTWHQVDTATECIKIKLEVCCAFQYCDKHCGCVCVWECWVTHTHCQNYPLLYFFFFFFFLSQEVLLYFSSLTLTCSIRGVTARAH